MTMIFLVNLKWPYLEYKQKKPILSYDYLIPCSMVGSNTTNYLEKKQPKNGTLYSPARDVGGSI